METLADQQAFLRRKKVVVKFTHLNPSLQETIGKRFFDLGVFTLESPSIRDSRTFRLFSEVAIAANIGRLGVARPLPPAQMALFSSLLIAGRTLFAVVIQAKHQELVEQMNENGILATEHEKHYPPDWIKPAEVARTHPIFFVAMNGDLVFLKENRRERARWEFQRTWMGKGGFNLWRWRAYLRPPKAPEPVKETLKGLLAAAREKASSLGGKPARAPAARFSKNAGR